MLALLRTDAIGSHPITGDSATEWTMRWPLRDGCFSSQGERGRRAGGHAPVSSDAAVRSGRGRIGSVSSAVKFRPDTDYYRWSLTNSGEVMHPKREEHGRRGR